MSHKIGRAAAAISSKRSFSRCRFLVTLDDHGGLMPINELAHACGWDLYRLRSVMFGDEGEDKSFSVERSPFALGQVVLYQTPDGEMVEITHAGREEVRALREEPHWTRGRLRKSIG